MAFETYKPPRKPAKFADPEDVDRATAHWSNEYLKCRTDGHYWQPSRATHNKRYGYWRRVQICHNCLSERTQELSEGYALLASWIDYPEGYLLEGLGRIAGEGRNVLRGAAFSRIYDFEEVKGRDATEDVPHSRAAREAVGYTGEYVPRDRRSA